MLIVVLITCFVCCVVVVKVFVLVGLDWGLVGCFMVGLMLYCGCFDYLCGCGFWIACGL